ncbi:Poly(U)-specific endoribonuclease-A [Fasciola gigantica]|uniref:Uridylate-specific endoribonuclease n=1 Tax=Fasciola gigantica TaxID=46835 RepID=A0A504YIX2_FASGI|nr:Poly(U)-specific endoribonuclease-A [Fasciola gigantica]
MRMSNTDQPRQIPRGIPPSVLDELSMLFSHQFAKSVKPDEIYVELTRIPWFRASDGTPLPLIPPRLTPGRVFRTEMDMVTKDILLNWDRNERERLISNFLDHLFRTSNFREVYEILHAREVYPDSLEEFGHCFRQVWFGLFSWDQMSPGVNRTCGFQHVYIGEKRANKVKGLHNWMRYYILEKSARLVLSRVHKKHPNLQIASIRFTYDEAVKPYGTIFFGLPIQFEIMLFFCAFIIGGSREVNFLIDGQRTAVISYDVATQNNMLATAFFKY